MQISAKVIADSVSEVGKRITTLEIEYPRFILAELNTHRMLSKNSSSSRAIPIDRVIRMVEESPAMPVHWGKNKPGMQAEEEVVDILGGKIAWLSAARSAVHHAKELNRKGLHKQVVNRVLEPYQWMKTVITGTEWENLWWLRDEESAQPEFRELASKMREAMKDSDPKLLLNGEWHLPYYNEGFWKPTCLESSSREIDEDGNLLYDEVVDEHGETLEDAIKISVSCCAQVSYRRLDDSQKKAEDIYNKLNLGDISSPSHASPAEHQATPFHHGLEGFITAEHRILGKMSGNFVGWVQYRQTIPNHTRW